jgi:hypothetical protein
LRTLSSEPRKPSSSTLSVICGAIIAISRVTTSSVTSDRVTIPSRNGCVPDVIARQPNTLKLEWAGCAANQL